MLLSGSLHDPLAFTVSGAGPLPGFTDRVHVGARLPVDTETVCEADPVCPTESVAVSVAVKVPVLV
jgi:hypothetical protein